MRVPSILISSATVLGATLALASAASGATLYTTGTHTTPVTVGTTWSATLTTPLIYTSATSALNSCTGSTQNLVLDQNSAGIVVGTFVSGSFTGCSPLSFDGIYTVPWKLEISGAPTTVGDVTAWPVTITNVAMGITGAGNYSGSFTTGVTARQTGATGATCLNFNDAGTLSGPLSTNFRLDTNYCFEGAAASYSLG